jgi:hypothetical protein
VDVGCSSFGAGYSFDMFLVGRKMSLLLSRSDSGALPPSPNQVFEALFSPTFEHIEDIFLLLFFLLLFWVFYLLKWV